MTFSSGRIAKWAGIACLAAAVPAYALAGPPVGANNWAHTVTSGKKTFRPSYSPAPQSAKQNPSKQGVSFQWSTDRKRLSVAVKGIVILQDKSKPWTQEDYARVLSVYTQPATGDTSAKVPPMLGTYSYATPTLRFESQFPPEPGMTYRAVVRPISRHTPTADAVSVFKVPARKSVPTTVVSRIYPTTDVLPENLLKFYVHFSAPMSRGHIYDHIRLLDEAGKPVELPFLEIDEELWDPTMTRLTLFIDPGRIKRGVKPLEDIGPALEEGKRYSLVIDRTWKDGAGNPLLSTYKKEFRVGPSDRATPDPDQWKIQPPASGSRGALTVAFPEPMDEALLHRFLRVTDANGKAVEGSVMVDGQEKRWSFRQPRRNPWQAGSYRLVVRTAIEDLAGNNIGKPFDVDLFETIERRISTSTITLPFEVK